MSCQASGSKVRIIHRHEGEYRCSRISSIRLASLASLRPWHSYRGSSRGRHSAGGKPGPPANGATGWVTSGTISDRTRLSEYRVGERRLRFWLEWDRGTMNARDLTIKFASYAHYLASREWAGEGAKPPWLLCISPEPAQERRIQRVAQASLLSITELVLWTTTSEWLCE
jgi:hypothetical protein